MIAYTDALPHAHQHLWSLWPPPPEWVYRLPFGKRVEGGWYFWYQLVPLRLIDDGLGPRFGGPKGFIVMDDCHIHIVSQLEKLRFETL